MQLLDQEGTRRVCKVLREGLQGQTVLLVSQAGSLPTRYFDVVDTVVKRQGSSTLVLG